VTEDVWLRCDDWLPMLEHLTGRMSKRKISLYVCAGLRSIWDLLYDHTSRNAVEMAERAADGAATEHEIGYATWAAECPTFGFDFDPQFIRGNMRGGDYWPGVKRLLEMGVYTEADIATDGRLGDEAVVRRLYNAADIAYQCLYRIDDEGLGEPLLEHLVSQPEWPGGWLVREVFGNPFCPVAVAPEWRTEAVMAIARGAYTERAFDRLPFLADALEDAGCDAAEMLAHCRGPGPHVLGCWALDLVLGKQAEPSAAADPALKAGRGS
jgi:hypothetical protein